MEINYTKEQVDEVINRFSKYGRGVLMSRYQIGANKSKTASQIEVGYADLINPELYSLSSLHGAYNFYYDKMNRQAIDPEVFGDAKVPLFIHETPLDEEIIFTAEDAFILVRAALLEQKRIQMLKDVKTKAQQAAAYLEANEGKKAKREKAENLIKEAEALGIKL